MSITCRLLDKIRIMQVLMFTSTDLGLHIRELRESAGLSQAELGKLVGISRAGVSQLEIGMVKSPKLWVLNAIAAAVNVPPLDVLYHAGVKQTDAAPEQLAWLAQQLDERHLRLLISIGMSLLQEQLSQRETESPKAAHRSR